MECQIGALPRTPFCLFEAFHPQGSVSLDSRVASLPYESSSLATSRGNEEIGGTGYCVTYDTDSQSRNVLASPLGEEGHEVAKGCTRVRSKNDTGRRLAVRTAMGCQIGALPRTPFPASRDFPSRGNEKYGEEKQRVIYFMYHSAVSPFGGERSEPIRRMLNMLYDIESQSRNAPCVPFRGRGPRSGEGVDGGNPDYDT